MAFTAPPLASAPTVPLTPLPRERVRRISVGRVVAGVLAVAAGVATLIGSWTLGVLDPTGRAADEALFQDAMSLGLRRDALRLLDLVGVPSIALAVVVLVGLALVRGRWRRALAVVAVVFGAQIVTQLVKASLVRPDGVENSLPSGHVTLVASLGVALVIAVPGVLRPLAALAALGVSAIAGVATMLAGWHRPSDVIAALGVVLAVTGAVSLLGAVFPAPSRPRSGSATRPAG